MRSIALALGLAFAACSPAPRRVFSIGMLEPVSDNVAAQARLSGLQVASQAPDGAAVLSAAVALKDGSGEVMADWRQLRFLAARAIATGASGVFLRLPRESAGQALTDFPEEWQAVDRLFRELNAMRPILEGGTPERAPFPVPKGVDARSWSFRGRRYVLLVNSSGSPQALPEKDLEPWRALFSARSDPRRDMGGYKNGRDFEAGDVLWLESRLLPEILR